MASESGSDRVYLRSHPFTALIALFVSFDDGVLPKLTDSVFAFIASSG
jgi:hypothetical protein